MSTVSWALWGITLLSALAATSLSLLGRRDRRLLAYGRLAVTVGAGVATAGLIHRTVVSGHLPLFGTFENTYAATGFLLVLSAAVAQKKWIGRDAWRLLVPWAIVFLLWGIRYRTLPTPLTISEQSIWVDIHVLFAWLAHSVLLWGSTLAVVRLVGRSRGPRPEAEDQLLFMLLSVGYVFLTVMINLGAWYLFVLFATFWRWEIVGVSAAAVWLGYSLLIHGRLLHGVKGAALDRYTVLMLVPLLFMFWVWSMFPDTYHFFDIPLVTP